jgi:hypothetical protein
MCAVQRLPKMCAVQHLLHRAYYLDVGIVIAAEQVLRRAQVQCSAA